MNVSLSRLITTLACSLALLSVAGTANAISIVRTYNYVEAVGVTSGGEVTFTDLGSNQLQIEIDNTSTGGAGGVSSAITGLVFDIDLDINSFSLDSFLDGSGNAISGWTLELDQGGSITPGNTVVDIYFAAGSINGGIYNAANPGININNLVPDIATLIITVSSPTDWALLPNGISGDILRMQRTGLNGRGSLKLPGKDPDDPIDPDPIPVPGTILLLGLGLMGLRLARRPAL